MLGHSRTLEKSTMRKMILMAIAGYLWKKYKTQKNGGASAAAAVPPTPPVQP